MTSLFRAGFFAIILSVFFSNQVKAQEIKDGLTWYTDVNQVYELSKQSGKPIFAFFTGSDWCGWCHRLEANVYRKPGFKEWAKKNVILLELDFPRNKKLPDELTRQNAGLQQFFNVQGYPTVWVFLMHKEEKDNKMSIEALGSLSYPNAEPGGEEKAFLASADAVMKNRK